MHHPDISNIMSIVEDYFILLDDCPPAYKLESISSWDGRQTCTGVKISRPLYNGCLVIDIIGAGRDDDSVKFTYEPDAEMDAKAQNFSLDDKEYCSEAVRKVVKKILTIDKNANRSACS